MQAEDGNIPGGIRPGEEGGAALNGTQTAIGLRRLRLRRIRRRLANDWQLYLLVLPALVYVFLFHYMPMYGVQIAFKDYSTRLGIWASPWAGLKHFERFLTYPNCWKIIRNTLSITLYSLATFPCAVIFALMLNEIHSAKYKRYVQMVSYMRKAKPQSLLPVRVR